MTWIFILWKSQSEKIIFELYWYPVETIVVQQEGALRQ